jgi:hypothetical protein
MEQTTKKSVTFRCDESLKAFLEAVGIQERRSMAQVIILMLEKGVIEYAKTNKDFMPMLPDYLNVAR